MGAASGTKPKTAQLETPAIAADPESGGFIHEELYRRLRTLILCGGVTRGSKLPSSRNLAATMKVSRTTVLAALDRLIADGYLEARRGSGVYVVYAGRVLQREGETEAVSTPRPFALGFPTDVFPVDVWSRLQRRVWRDTSRTILRQVDRLGFRPLREAIAMHAAVTRGIACSCEQVVVTTCIPASISLAVRALGLNGQRVWVENPCCHFYFGALARSIVQTVPVDVDEVGMNVSAGIIAAPDAKGVLMCAVRQAPTGVTLSGHRRAILAKWAEAVEAWILEDDFNWDGDGEPPSTPPFSSTHPRRALYLNSFNSTLFPGLRIAYLIVPPETVDRFAAICGSEGDVNAANQVTLAEFIQDGHFAAHARRLNELNRERRALLSSIVQTELSEFLSPQNNLGGYFICDLNGLSEQAAVQAAQTSGVNVVGTSGFYLTAPPREQLVLGFSQFNRPAMQRAATTLQRAFRDATARPRTSLRG
jgi:GntR family transcriptional regulator/MocR family aminotransferase